MMLMLMMMEKMYGKVKEDNKQKNERFLVLLKCEHSEIPLTKAIIKIQNIEILLLLKNLCTAYVQANYRGMYTHTYTP